MRSLKIAAMAAASTLMLVSYSARADVPNGSYSNDFSGVVLLWDISGPYSAVLANGPTVSFTLTETSSGSFTGSGTFSINDGTFNISNGNSSVAGKISGSSSKAKVTMATMLTGTGTVSGNPASVAATVRITFTTVGEGQLAANSGSVSVKAQDTATGKKISRTVKVGANTFPLPANATGQWGLALNLTPNGTKLTGTGSLATSAGTTVPLTASGTYSSSSDTAKIKLTGSGVSLNLVVSTSGSTMTVESGQGKAFGQSLKF